MEPSEVFSIIVLVNTLCTAWEMYLIYRQRHLHAKRVERSNDISSLISQEDYDKARLYSIDRLSLKLFRLVIDYAFMIVLLYTHYYSRLWEYSENISESYALAIFMAIHSFITYIFDLPISLYENFVVEQLHGFNKYTLQFYLLDSVKKLGLTYVFVTPLSMGAVWLIDNGGQYFYVYVWIFISIIIFGMMTIYPSLIAPLFDKYSPLPEGKLKKAIEDLAASVNYPLHKLFVVDGSKRSGHSNAYMYGLWKNKRIVLYDTLLSCEEKKKVYEAIGKDEKDIIEDDDKGMGVDEVVAVVGHELGHWAKWHTISNLCFSELNILFSLFIFSLFHNNIALAKAFGFKSNIPSLLSLLIVLQYVMAAYNELIGLVMVVMTRRMEFQADEYAAKLGHSSNLRSALIKLSKDNLSLPINDWLYSTCRHTHPPVTERITALSKCE